MNIQNVLLNSLVFIIPIITAIYITVGIKLFKQKAEHKINYFSLFMFAAAVYSFGYFLELNCESLDMLLLVRNFEYFGAVFIPTFAILFIGELTKVEITKKVTSSLILISLMLWLIFITNPVYNLIYKSIDLQVIDGFGVVFAIRGPAFYSMMIYYSFFLMFSIIVLFRAYKNSITPRTKRSFLFLLISLQLPWFTMLFILLGLDTYIDPVPVTIMIICILLGINQLKNDMFELETKKWNHVFLHGDEPAFLVNKRGEVISFNSNADVFFEAVNKDIRDILKNLNDAELIRKPAFFTIDDEERWFEIEKNNFDLKKGFTNYCLVDITKIKRLEMVLTNDKKLLETTLKSLGDGVISTDKEGNIVFLNKVSESLTGWSQEEANGKPIEDVFNIINEDTGEKSRDIIKKALESRKKQTIKNRNLLISKDGNKHSIEDSTAPILDENGEIEGVVLVFRDYSEQKKKQEHILYLNYHDHLTGLYNRRFYEEEVLRLDTKRNLPLTIVMGDVNGLKLMNDAFGHPMGDELLKKAAEGIKKGCRNDEIIARLGGDEFIILLPKTDAFEAEKIIKRIKDEMSYEKVGAFDISISFGSKTKENEEENIRDIFKKAEDNMYQHKLYESSNTKSKNINLIINTLYEKSRQERMHSKRVSKICETIAIKMNFEKNAVNQIKMAGLIHDIGKMGIDKNILNKSEKLNPDEYLEMQKHPEIGYRILNCSDEFSEMAKYILQHHERWDGKGYPKGIRDEKISLQARIIAVANTYDAMTNDRTYRRGLSEEEAINEIKKGAGTKFDPEIVKLFNKECIL